MSLSMHVSISRCKYVLNSVCCTTAFFKTPSLIYKNSQTLKRSCLKTNWFMLSTMANSLEIKPPARVKGMTKWDTEAFKDTIEVPCLLCSTEKLNAVRKVVKSYMIKLKQFDSIVDLDCSDECFKTHRLILLDPAKYSGFESLPEKEVKTLKEAGVQEDDFQTKQVEISHKNWSFSDIIRAIVPDEIEESSTGYSEIGHIAHFNLKEEMLPYKDVVGEAMLECSRKQKIKTVVNKTNIIDNTYRTFQLELLAGEENYLTQVKENNCTFEMDFSKVYWNSRLGTEHSRVIDESNRGDLVLDVFAGIGPFAIPCAKKGIIVYANDLNPVSYEYLVKNKKKNKISEDNLKAYCMDGREFIQTVVKDELIRRYREGSVYVDYKVLIVMNLPAIAVTFIDTFQSLLHGQNLTFDTKHDPIVYCYCFTDIHEANEHWDGDTDREIKERAMKYLPALSLDDITLRLVRNVAPKKHMMCINFVLRRNILFGEDDQERESGEPPSKSRKKES